VKRSGRDKPIWIVIHVYVETAQGISLYSYLYLKLPKTPCSSYYLLCFSSIKPENNRVKQVLPGGGRGGREVGGGPNNVYTCK
jgi:hypothetical protein